MNIVKIFIMSIFFSQAVYATIPLSDLEYAKKVFKENEKHFSTIEKLKSEKNLVDSYATGKVKPDHLDIAFDRLQISTHIQYKYFGEKIPEEDVCLQHITELRKDQIFPLMYVEEQVSKQLKENDNFYVIDKKVFTVKDNPDFYTLSDGYDHFAIYSIENQLVNKLDCDGDQYSPLYILESTEDKKIKLVSQQEIIGKDGKAICTIQVVNVYEQFVEGKTNQLKVIKQEKPKAKESRKTTALSSSPDPEKLEIKAGCHSRGSSMWALLATMGFLLIWNRRCINI